MRAPSGYTPRDRPVAPYASGSETSFEAASAIEEYRPSIALSVFQFIAATPSTCFEVEQALDGIHQTISPRFNELHNSGCIQPTGEQRPSSRVGGKDVMSDVYEVVPGATFDRYLEWAKEERQRKSAARAEKAHLIEAARLLYELVQFGVQPVLIVEGAAINRVELNIWLAAHKAFECDDTFVSDAVKDDTIVSDAVRSVTP